MPKTNFTSKLLDMEEFNFKDIKITDTQIYISVEMKRRTVEYPNCRALTNAVMITGYNMLKTLQFKENM